MGKSSGRKKKVNAASGEGSTKLDPDDAVFLKRAHELKDEGNRRFQAKDYIGAMDIYEQALKLTPEGHPDRAVFYSNRAACLLQVKPAKFENVVLECTLALEAHPKFGKALFRRARAYEALGKLQLALTDVQLLLQSEPNNQDALEQGKRLRLALGNSEGAQQDTPQRRSGSLSTSTSDTANSPATPGAADESSGQGGRGPSLPARPSAKKKGGRSTVDPDVTVRTSGEGSASVVTATPSSSPAANVRGAAVNDGKNLGNATVIDDQKLTRKKGDAAAGATKSSMRQLKLIFGHDIRRAEIPANCGFGHLKEVVRKRFPSLKAALIKYQDLEGDLVTITSREELRLAEAEVEAAERAKKQSMQEAPSQQSVVDGTPTPVDKQSNERGNASSLELVRLHIVEVSAEQEPPVPEDDDLVDMTEDVGNEEDVIQELVQAEENSDGINDLQENGQALDAKAQKSKKEDGQPVGEEMEIDDWLFDFAQLFRTHVGIDPDGHVDFHELGMELCSEALDAVVTSEEAQPLFESAASKFQEVAALALFNWGNVYMCAARKTMPMPSEDAGKKSNSKEQQQAAFEWAQGQYTLAGQKYEEALRIKPDFYEGVLALGQEKFESAKLQWAAAVASDRDLTTWDSAETLDLFRFAEERMKTAAEMWEQLEAQQGVQDEVISKSRKEQPKPESATAPEEGISSVDAVEQSAAMRSQINLFWGNVLFEHSQVEFRLGLSSWKELLDSALEKFVSAGAATEEIENALKNHPGNMSIEKGLASQIADHVHDLNAAKREADSNGHMEITDDKVNSRPGNGLKDEGGTEEGPEVAALPGAFDAEGDTIRKNSSEGASSASGYKLDNHSADRALNTDKSNAGESGGEFKGRSRGGSEKKKTQGRGNS